MNISKIHLHVEQFSLKTNQRLIERLFYNQTCKEISTQSQVEREDKQSCLDKMLGPAFPRGETEEE